MTQLIVRPLKYRLVRQQEQFVAVKRDWTNQLTTHVPVWTLTFTREIHFTFFFKLSIWEKIKKIKR